MVSEVTFINPLVSIIMPAYNVEKYIKESVESIIGQTYLMWELIVVNDGSKDNTPEILEQLASRDYRIQIVNQKNQGVAAARNTGIAKAKGAYVSFLDADDTWDSAFLSELVAAIERTEVDAVYCGFKTVYESGRGPKSYPFKYLNGRILKETVQGISWLHVGALLIKRNVLELNNLQFSHGCSMGEDLEFIYKLLAVSKVDSVSKELMNYRVRPGSALRSKWDWAKHIQVVPALKRAIDFIESRTNQDASMMQAKQALEIKAAQARLRIMWRMVKRRDHKEVLRMLEDNECQVELANLKKHPLKLVDRLKLNILFSRFIRLFGS